MPESPELETHTHTHTPTSLSLTHSKTTQNIKKNLPEVSGVEETGYQDFSVSRLHLLPAPHTSFPASVFQVGTSRKAFL